MRKKCLHGLEAIRYRFKRSQGVYAGHHLLEDMKEFRCFKWFLSNAEWKQVESWQACQVLMSKDKIMNRQKALKDLEDKQKMIKGRPMMTMEMQCTTAESKKAKSLQCAMSAKPTLWRTWTHLMPLQIKLHQTWESWASLEPRQFD